MRYTQFGRTGLRVSELCLGTMTFGPDWGWGADRDTSREMFDLFTAAGGNFLDTANVYTAGTSERFVGEFVQSDRSRFVISTKYSLSTRLGDPNAGGNHRKNLVQSVDASLKAMNVDYIDILWLHAWDFLTPEDEVLRGLDDLVRAGKILYTGISDTPAWIIARSNAIADLRGWTAFGGVQLPYSLIERSPEREFFPMARALDLAVVSWGALSGGILTGKYREGAQTPASGRLLAQDPVGDGPNGTRTAAIVDTLCQIAAELGCAAGQVALAWVRQRDVPIIPLLGARTVAQLKNNLSCLELLLSADHVAALNQISQIEYGFPHDFLNTPAMIGAVYGDTIANFYQRKWYGK